jgi:hypothetical protein
MMVGPLAESFFGLASRSILDDAVRSWTMQGVAWICAVRLRTLILPVSTQRLARNSPPKIDQIFI